jgi:hypothetical protein
MSRGDAGRSSADAAGAAFRHRACATPVPGLFRKSFPRKRFCRAIGSGTRVALRRRENAGALRRFSRNGARPAPRRRREAGTPAGEGARMPDTPKTPEQDPLDLDNLPAQEVEGEDVKGGFTSLRPKSSSCNSNTLTCKNTSTTNTLCCE